MNRTQRCELLARLADSELAELAGSIAPDVLADRVVIVEPTVGMIMARAIEGAHGEVFNVGEVLVTECQVQIDRHEGWAMVTGSRPRGALAAASLDAAVAAGRIDAAALATLDERIARLIAGHDAAAVANQASLAATRVQFETQ